MNDLKLDGHRRLHPFKAYISLECGRALLGRRTNSTRVSEFIESIVDGTLDVDALQALWLKSGPSDRMRLETKLRMLAGSTELGDNERILALKKAERSFGALVMKHWDPFRAIASALAPHVAAGGFAIATFEKVRKLPKNNFVEIISNAIKEGAPLPMPDKAVDRHTVEIILEMLVELWPLRIMSKVGLGVICAPPQNNHNFV